MPFNIGQGLNQALALDPGYRAIFVAGGFDAQGLQSSEIRALDLSCPVYLSCASTLYAQTDPSMLNQLGERVFMRDGDTLTLATNNPGEVGTDASQLALLYATG